MEAKILELKALEKKRSNLNFGEGIKIFTINKDEDYYYPKERFEEIQDLFEGKKFTTYEEVDRIDVRRNPDLQEEYEYQQEQIKKEKEKRRKEAKDRTEIQTPPLPLPGNPEEITTVAQNTIPVANQGGLGITSKARINEFGDIVKNTTV